MGADHADRVARLPTGADSESHDRRTVPRQVVFAAGLDRRGPVVALSDLGEPRILKERSGTGNSMVGWVLRRNRKLVFSSHLYLSEGNKWLSALTGG